VSFVNFFDRVADTKENSDLEDMMDLANIPILAKAIRMKANFVTESFMAKGF
jgi:hypothetical protein